MAWSDAARRAALEVRRRNARYARTLHKGAKAAAQLQHTGPTMDAATAFSAIRRSQRTALAKSLRMIRRTGGTKYGLGDPKLHMRMAAKSTMIRNRFFGGSKTLRDRYK